MRNGPGWFANLEGQTVTGYEIHMGRTKGQYPWLEITQRNGRSVSVAEGDASTNGKVWGCYFHGLFANENFRRAWLTDLGWSRMHPMADPNPFADSLTRLADTLEQTLDMTVLEKIIWED
jgi:adenosylcobyric acid synthase